MEENEGNIGLVDKTIRAAVPPDLREAYNLAALSALDAMRKFQDHLQNGLAGGDDNAWRMTGDQYMRKFRFTLESGVEADTMLQMAERELVRVRPKCWSWPCRCTGSWRRHTRTTPSFPAPTARTR